MLNGFVEYVRMRFFRYTTLTVFLIGMRKAFSDLGADFCDLSPSLFREESGGVT
jgi:hypothetical protein